jgi:23S rRNA (cytidine1920-2'-O)/16S rRNA (cytidine1409-2'-O)-methyltransferase
VYAVDVGYGQLDWKLRNNPRVVVIEKTNIRYLENDRIPAMVDISTIDVSFISLLKVIPKVMEFLRTGGELIALIKPQFEAQKKYVRKGGVVKEENSSRSKGGNDVPPCRAKGECRIFYSPCEVC